VSGSSEFLHDVLAGLDRPRRSIPGKYLWDEAGSALFDEICGDDRYYVTGRENVLLRRIAPELTSLVGAGASLVEFGSGSSHKVRILLDALPMPWRYVAVDISRAYLEAATARMVADYPALEVVALCGDYTQSIPIPPPRDGAPVLGFFPGTTVGNFDEPDLVAFLQRVRMALGPSWFLVGADPNQDADSLLRAYGMPAMGRFHENLLVRMGRELGACIEPADFRHQARLTGPPIRVEAHLVAQKRTVLQIDGRSFAMEPGETICTDISCKHSPEMFQAIARRAGWEPVRCWMDKNKLFSLHLLRA
jgi:L-histidine Nalpha-methyltransferase